VNGGVVNPPVGPAEPLLGAIEERKKRVAISRSRIDVTPTLTHPGY
jgi:hypothetical protein